MSIITTSITNVDSNNTVEQTITTESYNFNNSSQTLYAGFNKSFASLADDMIYNVNSINADTFKIELPSSKEKNGKSIKINNCNALFEPFHSFDFIRVHLIIPNCKTNNAPETYVYNNKAHNYGIGLMDEQNGIKSIKIMGWFNMFVHDKQDANGININDIRIQIGTGPEQQVKYLYGSGVIVDRNSNVSDTKMVSVSVGGVEKQQLEWFNTNMIGYTVKFQILQIVLN